MDNNVLAWLDRSSVRFPNKIVYRDTRSALTFEELRAITLTVGRAIARLLPPGSPVAVLSGRHVYTPAAYLGVVRAGCFYAPMDGDLPEPRLRQILEVAEPKVLIADREHEERVRTLGYEGMVLVLEELLGADPADGTDDRSARESVDGPADVGRSDSPEDPKLAARWENHTETEPLYMIFTSGSTGRPKGVLTSHHALACYLDGVQEVLGLTEEDVLGSQSPMDYIAAIRDIYLPLLTGAETVFLPKSDFAMGGQLFRDLNDYGVTAICWSSAGLELPAQLGAFEEGAPKSIRKVVFSGSVLPGRVLALWQQHLPEAVFINQYGPTEATGSCTYYRVKQQAGPDTVLPIGRPFRHFRILLLREDGTEAAPGEEGEICVLGPALALGYYGKTEESGTGFTWNPLNEKYLERMYRSGDIGRWREDGELLFLGRRDRQVKHLGHRIELDEIEIAARQVEGVAECASLYDEEKTLLWLFYSGDATPKEIVLHFRKSMPPFMVPRKIVKLEELPHLPNGKLDRKSLRLQ